MRRGIKIRMAVLAAAVLFLLCTALPVSAAGEGYSYTVRIYAGTKGQFKGGNPEVMVLSVPAGGKVCFEAEDIVLPEGSRYRVKGIRRSGEDRLANSSFTVYEDADYVVAYGVEGDLVSYKISYVDENGKELVPAKTGEGNVGDMPIVGHLPIEGYRPQAYNLTRTLRKEGGNEFTFRYTKIQSEGTRGPDSVTEEVDTVTNIETVVVPGNTENGTDRFSTTVVTGGEVSEMTGGNGETAPAENDSNVSDAENGQGVSEEENGPRELINLDDEETPLAGVQDKESGLGAGKLLEVPHAVYVGLISAVVLLAAGLYFMVVGKMRKEAKEEKDE